MTPRKSESDPLSPLAPPRSLALSLSLSHSLALSPSLSPQEAAERTVVAASAFARAAKDEAATKLAAADFLTRVATGGSAAAKGFLARVATSGAGAAAGDEAAGVGGSGGDAFVRANTDGSAQVRDGTRRGCGVHAPSSSLLYYSPA